MMFLGNHELLSSWLSLSSRTNYAAKMCQQAGDYFPYSTQICARLQIAQHFAHQTVCAHCTCVRYLSSSRVHAYIRGSHVLRCFFQYLKLDHPQWY